MGFEPSTTIQSEGLVAKPISYKEQDISTGASDTLLRYFTRRTMRLRQ
jgi:hypothetical protein